MKRKSGRRDMSSRRAALIAGRTTVQCSGCGVTVSAEMVCLERVDLQDSFRCPELSNLRLTCRTCVGRRGQAVRAQREAAQA